MSPCRRWPSLSPARARRGRARRRGNRPEYRRGESVSSAHHDLAHVLIGRDHFRQGGPARRKRRATPGPRRPLAILNSCVREALLKSVTNRLRAGEFQTSQLSTVPRQSRLPPPVCGFQAGSPIAIGPCSRETAGRPESRFWSEWFPPYLRRSAWQISALRRHCQTMQGAMASPSQRFQATTVSL